MTDGPIVWRLGLSSRPDAVFGFLATTEGRESFWAEEAPESESVIRFRFVNGWRTDSRIRVSEPPSLFEIEYFGSVARFELEPSGEGTELTLINSGVSPEEREEVLPGWVSVLLHLKAAVDHGIDLRLHDPARTWDQRYVDQ